MVKSKNLSSLEEAIKESIEEEKLIESNKSARRLLQGNTKQENGYKPKYCSICHRNNHNTVQCKFSNGNKYKQEAEQRNNSPQTTKFIKKVSCSYCKATGHIREECFKKKKADVRQTEKQNSRPSENEAGPSTSGERSVRDMKNSAQM